MPKACVILVCLLAISGMRLFAGGGGSELFAQENLMAWCIVPFDGKKRSPEERARMLRELEIRQLAYDYRQEHVATFDAEMEALKREGIALTAWWFPGELNDEARLILEVIRRHGVRPQLWVTGSGGPVATAEEQAARVAAEAARIAPIARAAAEPGCTVGLYNHGGWFGDPENQIAVIERLQAEGISNVGIVYNQHHGHGDIERFAALLPRMKPWLIAFNLNGMEPGADGDGRKIMPVGQGGLDVILLRLLCDSGWRGPVGLLNHTDEDAELRLRDNLDGLRWVVSQLEGAPPSPPPQTRSWQRPPIRRTGEAAVMPLYSAPLDPVVQADWLAPVNAGRVYDFYTKQADWFLRLPERPVLLSAFPGLQGERPGHWGTQNEETWTDNRWNASDPGSMQSGVFHAGDLTVTRGICVNLDGLAVCYDPDTITYRAAWTGGFVRRSDRRWGLLDGIRPDGTLVPLPEQSPPSAPFRYLGCHRVGRQVVFRCEIGGEIWLDAPSVRDGEFVRTLARESGHPLAAAAAGGGPAQWPEVLTAEVTEGRGEGAYVIDTIGVPFGNPWRALMFFGGHDFSPDGTAWLCTIQGDVWRVTGFLDGNGPAQWRRYASGLHQPLGLVFADGVVHVACRDRIVRLHDRNGDGEADYYESFSDAFESSPAGHDYVCGLERDEAGRFYLATGNQGVVRISADGRHAESLATGFRNPDGLGLLPDGGVTVPQSEGEWVPASSVSRIVPGSHYGYGGPRNGETPALPMVYLPRGLDNSSGGQLYVNSDRWGPLSRRLLHFSYGAGAHFLVLQDEGVSVPQGAVVPLPGGFASGVHRGRVNPADGQVYVTGMTGWGTYTAADGCFQRIRYTGREVQVPVGVRCHENGVLVEFERPVEPAVTGRPEHQFAQAWNYRYSHAYGSPEFSPSRPGVRGHDVLAVSGVHVGTDGRSVFLEIPDLQPVNQLHLRLRTAPGEAHDLFVTVHALAAPFTAYDGYRPAAKWIRPHPMVADLEPSGAAAVNPYLQPIGGAVAIRVAAGTNLTYQNEVLSVPAGTAVALTFSNPDVVPHNWVLVQRGKLDEAGREATRLITDAKGAARGYVPDSEEVIAWTPMVNPGAEATIFFRAPREPGDYPYLCTFPGHWMIMNGVLRVTPASSSGGQ